MLTCHGMDRPRYDPLGEDGEEEASNIEVSWLSLAAAHFASHFRLLEEQPPVLEASIPVRSKSLPRARARKVMASEALGV